MSTLRINNIEAQSIPASPTIDEKVKVTNSSGDILVNIDGKTSGITTIGINTTDGNIKFDANSNVLITGILTATTLAGNFTPDSLEIGSNIKLGNAGVITATSFVGSGANLTGIDATKIITGNTQVQTIDTGSDGHIKFTTEGTERARIVSDGKVGINTTSPTLNGNEEGIHIVSDDYPTVHLTNQTTGHGASNGSMFTLNNSGETIIRNGHNSHIRFDTNGSNERLRITSGGKLLVGTSSDYAENVQAAFYGASNGGIALASGTSGSSRLMFADGTSGSGTGAYIGSIIYAHSDNSMRFTTNVSERLRIRSDGKISTGTSINNTNTYEFSVTGADGTGGFYAHGRNHYISNRSNAYASLTLKKANADSDGTDYLQLRDSSNALKLSLSGDGSINGDTVTKLKVAGNEKLRINTNSLWLNSDGMPSSSSGAKLQVGAHTFAGNNFAYHTSRLGIQNNGSLTCIANCSTYTDGTYPGYGLIMVQGASTSDYNTFGICPDSPQTGGDLNFHSGYRKSNIHSDANVRQMWINMSGQVYKRDNGANWNQTSDERLKKNIVDNNIGLAEINQLRITSFEYRKADEIDISLFPKADNPLQVIIEGEEGPHTGVIAQEIESVLPECVKTSEKGAKTVQADAVTWALVNAVKELSAKNDALEERIKNLEGS